MLVLKKSLLLWVLLVVVGGVGNGEQRFIVKFNKLKECIWRDDADCVAKIVDEEIKPIGINKFRIERDKPLLWFAAEQGAKKVVGMLLKKGADVGVLGPRKKSSLHIAVEKDKASVVKKLVGAVLDQKDYLKGVAEFEKLIQPSGWRFPTLVHLAIDRGHHKSLKELLRSDNEKANKDILAIEDKRNRTPLALAMEANKMGCASVLMLRGARDKNGNTPLHMVIKKFLVGKEETENFVEKTLSWFVGYEVDLTAKNKRGQTPLHLLAKSEDERAPKIGRLFFEKDEKLLDVEDKLGLNPFAVAAYSGNTEFITTIFKFKKREFYDAVVDNIKYFFRGRKGKGKEAYESALNKIWKKISETSFYKENISKEIAEFVSSLIPKKDPEKTYVPRLLPIAEKHVERYITWTKKYVSPDVDWPSLLPLNQTVNGACDYLIEQFTSKEKWNKEKIETKLKKYQKIIEFLLNNGAEMKPREDEKWWVMFYANKRYEYLLGKIKSVKPEKGNLMKKATEIFKENIFDYLAKRQPTRKPPGL